MQRTSGSGSIGWRSSAPSSCRRCQARERHPSDYLSKTFLKWTAGCPAVDVTHVLVPPRRVTGFAAYRPYLSVSVCFRRLYQPMQLVAPEPSGRAGKHAEPPGRHDGIAFLQTLQDRISGPQPGAGPRCCLAERR